jgi:hypothetical protein
MEVAAASKGAIWVSVFHFESIQSGEQREQVGVCMWVCVCVGVWVGVWVCVCMFVWVGMCM